MFRFRHIILILIGILGLNLLPVHAQDSQLSETELEHLSIVQAAVDSLLQRKSFHTDVQVAVTQQISAGSGFQAISLNQDISQVMQYDLLTDGNGNISGQDGTMIQNFVVEASGVEVEFDLTMEIILQDMEYFLRITDGSPELRTTFPRGWFRFQDIPTEGFDFSSLESLTSQEAMGIIDFTEDLVISISEMPSETINDQTMRVFALGIDPAFLLESGASGVAFDTSTAFGRGAEAATNAIIENATVFYTIWIGVDDNYVHQMVSNLRVEEVELFLEGENISLAQQSSGTITYTDFDAPVEIRIIDPNEQ